MPNNTNLSLELYHERIKVVMDYLEKASLPDLGLREVFVNLIGALYMVEKKLIISSAPASFLYEKLDKLFEMFDDTMNRDESYKKSNETSH